MAKRDGPRTKGQRPRTMAGPQCNGGAMSALAKGIVAVVVVAILAAAGVWYWNASHTPALPPPPSASAPPPVPAAPAGPVHPIEGASEEKLPPLAESDGVIGAA